MNIINSEFKIIGTKIYDPNGQEFIVKGTNMFDWEGMDNVSSYVYAWGFNTLRVPNYLLGSYDLPHPEENGYSINHQIVDAFTSQGTVVMFDAHDRIGGYYEEEEWEILKDYWREMAQEFKDNSNVWFNLHNEPGNDVARSEKWVSYHRELIDIVRAEGANNLIVVDGEAWGQDYHTKTIANYADEVIEGNENILFSLHVYDQWMENDIGAYFDTLHSQNIPVIIGEYGSSNETHDTLATSINAIEEAQEREIGRVVWVAKGDDISDLTTGEGGDAEHFDGTNPEILTALGSLVWNDIQRSEALEQLPSVGDNYNQLAPGVFQVDSSGKVQFNFLFNGNWKEGELAIFSLEGMEEYIPGTQEYIQQAAIRAASNSTEGYILASETDEAALYSSAMSWEYNFNYDTGTYQGIKTFDLTASGQYALFLVPNGTVAEIAEDPSLIATSNGYLPLFSLPEANPNATQGQLVAVDNYNTFAFEDDRVDLNLSDGDYNDFVFQLQGVNSNVPTITDWNDSTKNWLNTDIGQEILNYSESAYNIDSQYGSTTGVFQVGETGEVQFDFLFNGEWTAGELAIFSLEGMEEYIPGTQEFIQQAAIRATSNSTQGYILASEQQQEAAKFSSSSLSWEYDHNFEVGEYQGIKLFNLTPGDSYGLFFVPNGTAVEIANDPSIIWDSNSNFPLFSMPEANPGTVEGQMVAVDGFNTFAFENNRIDWNLGDRDYNDFVFQLQGVEESGSYKINDWINSDRNWLTTEIGETILEYSESVYGITTNYQFDSGVIEVGESGQIQFEYLFNGEWTNSELGIFSLEGMGEFIPGTEDFIQEAAIRAASNSTQGYILASEQQQEAAKFSSSSLSWEFDHNFEAGEYQGINLFDLTPGDRYGLFLVPNGTVSEIANEPSIIWDSEAALPLFSLPEANPDVAEGQIVAVDQFNTFAFEANRVDRDLSDHDYNDFVFQLQGVTASVPQINDLIDSEKNWLTTEIGETILEYSESVYGITTNYQFDSGVIEVGASGQIQFEYLFNGEWTNSELGIFSLEGMGEFIPGTEDFIQEAAIRAASNSTQGYILASEQQQEAAKFSSSSLSWEFDHNFEAGEYQGINLFDLTPGDRYGLFLVPNGTVSEIANEPSIIWDSEAALPLFSLPEANPDVAQGQMVAVDQFNTFAFEANRVDRDLSDHDYNDFVFQLQGVTTSVPQINDLIDSEKNWLTTEIGQTILEYSESVYGVTTNYQFDTGVLEVGESGEIQFDYLFNGEWTKGELGIFSLENMEAYIPGTEEFIEEAAIRAASNSTQGYILASEQQQEAAKYSSGMSWEYNYNYNAGEYQGINLFDLTPGDRYGLFLVPNGTVEAIANEPSIIWDSNSALPLFSMPEANPDVAEGQMVAVDEFNTFAFEANRVDRNLGDRDYNDFVFQLQGVTTSVPQIGDWINSEKNWLTTEIGQTILDYSESVYIINNNIDENETLIGGAANDNLVSGSGHDVLQGKNGDDYIAASEGNDYLEGGSGNDTLYGDGDQDTLVGGKGNDFLDGGWSNDTIQGNIGDDTLIGAAGDDYLDGGSGDDTIYGGLGDDTLIGGKKADSLDGGEDNDILKGNGGDDTLIGAAGNDYLEGGSGDDTIYGGLGNDTLIANQGHDFLDGGDGNDSLKASNGNNIIIGGLGNDTLIGGKEADSLDGGEDNDTIQGNIGDDTLIGAAGDDYLNGGSGNNTLNGGLGNDTLIANQGHDFLDGGDGNDSLKASNGNNIIIGGLGNDTLIGGKEADSLDGGEDNDTIQGNIGDDTLIGAAGDDYLNGGSGNNTLNGGLGDDTLIANQGNDFLDGGEGDDSLKASSGNNIIIGGLGNDTLIGGKEADSLNGGEDNDTLKGNIGNDTLIGATGNDYLNGGSGNDSLNGGEDNDTLKGNIGDDTLIGATGNDYLEGGSGNNTLNGGLGNDTLIASQGNDFLDGGEGDDSLKASSGHNIIIGGLGNDTLIGGKEADSLNGGDDHDSLKGNSGNDTLEGADGDDYLHGGSGQDYLYGDLGNDTLIGGKNDDYLYGGEGDDLLQASSDRNIFYGGSGNDTLIGGKNDDYLDGGLGNDLLIGGKGRDTFALAANSGIDLIVDFQINLDSIVLLDDFSNSDLTITQGTGDFSNDAILSLTNTDSILAILENISPAQFDSLELLN